MAGLIAFAPLAACGDDDAMDVADAAEDSGECPPGSLDCSCDEMGACQRGHCVADRCQLCTRGEDACLCRRDGTCADGFACRDELCVACPAGEPTCGCAAGRCNEGASCQDGVCAADECAPGSADCPCRIRSAPACDDDLRCLGDGMCRACEADAAGCPCDDEGSCRNGLSCELGLCQAPPTCEDLRADGFCAPAERCTMNDGVAECLRGQCEAGFVFIDGQCVAGMPNCEPSEPGSRVEECATLSRGCVVVEGRAECGDCIGDTVEVDGLCQGPVPCGDSFCQSFQYCDRSVADEFCADLPCPPGQARGSTGTCTPCGFTCSGEGLSGRVFPFRTITDACVCETLPGWYMPPGGSTTPEACDADSDGWVRAEVTENLIEVDPTLKQNARCDLLLVDGVVLRDEHGLSIEVASCEDGLFANVDPAACAIRVPMPLVESRRNDAPGPVGGAETGAPGTYGSRRLVGAEVNDLTKFCVDDVSDFNDDGTVDLLEAQAPGDTLGSADGRTRLRSFSHFVELHRAYVEPPPSGGRFGKLIVEERYRCDPRDFPLRYDDAVDPAAPTDGYRPDTPETYWRSCQRGVDPAFTPATPSPGYDFAQWSCAGDDCSAVPEGPPDDRMDLVGEALPLGTAPPIGATLCELGARFPADGLWRGMHHHSQFKCVHAGALGEVGVPLGSVNDGSLVLNECEAIRCDGSDASCVGSRFVSPTSQAQEPLLQCRALDNVSSPQVGFAAVSYRPYGTRFITVDGDNADYRGGCINEDAEFAAHLCPGPVFRTNSRTDGFGRESCFVAPCPLGQADCDGNEFNGCEMEARSLTDCSGCGVPCALPNATATCATGECKVLACNFPWGDCDGNPDNGCETLLRNDAHCAACNRACIGVGGAEASCASGACLTVSCPEGMADCNGDVGDGCETPLNTNTDCGGCDVACAPPNTTSATCVSGTCEVLGCDAGFGDCDGAAGTGCEVDLRTSLEHCGFCSSDEVPTRCELNHASGACASGVCTLDSCDAGYADCDGVPGTGCEVATDFNDTHCGACFERCSIPNAIAECNEGSCERIACVGSRSDCDDEIAGCETRHDTSRGACGMGEDLGMMGGDLQCPNGFLGICIDDGSFDELAVRKGTDSAWFTARVVEATTCSAAIEHRIRLDVPDGVNYDLHVQRDCAEGSAVATSSGPAGVDESITERRGDAGGRDDSFTYYIFVEYVDGASCVEWELVVEGHAC